MDLVKLMNFMQNFKGDPRQIVMSLINSGRMSNDQFEHLQQQANQIMEIIGRR